MMLPCLIEAEPITLPMRENFGPAIGSVLNFNVAETINRGFDVRAQQLNQGRRGQLRERHHTLQRDRAKPSSSVVEWAWQQSAV